MELDRLPDGRPLAALSLAELREACGSRGLSKGGSRKDLSDRLKLRLELEKLREESTRKAKAKEDVVPNIGLQDTAVGQSDIVRQYLEAQQRRLELFAQHGQAGGQPQQLQTFPAAANATAVAAAERAPAAVTPAQSASATHQLNHAQSLGGYEHKGSKARSASGVPNAKAKGITTRKGKGAAATAEGSSPAHGALSALPIVNPPGEVALTDVPGHAAVHSGAKSGKATRSRAANNNFSNTGGAAAGASKYEVLPSQPAKKTRLGSAPPSLPAAIVVQPPGGGVPQEDQLVPSLPALQTTKRRRGAVQPPPNTISRAEPVTAVKSSPRATKTATSQIEPQRAPVPPESILEAVTAPPPLQETSPPVKRGRGRPRKNAIVVPRELVPRTTLPAVTAAAAAATSAPIAAPPVQSVAEQPASVERVQPAVKPGSSPASTGSNNSSSSSLRERGRDKKRHTLLEEAKPPKVSKVTQEGHEDQVTGVAAATVIATKGAKMKSEKCPPLPEPVRSSKDNDKPQDAAKPTKEIFATKRSERATNRADNQIEAHKEAKEGRPTRAKRFRSQDDMTTMTPSTDTGGGICEPNKKLNKSNRQARDNKGTAISAIKSEPTRSPTEKLTDKGVGSQESLPIDDPIEAALLALHGGCDDRPPSISAESPQSQVPQETPAHTNSALSRGSKARGGSLRDARNRAPSVEGTLVGTKTPSEAVPETHPFTASISPGSSPLGTTADTKASPTTSNETSSTKEIAAAPHGIKELPSKSPPSGSQSPLKSASASPPSDRTETRRSDRNQRETRKRSKVENIVQRLARREGRCSNTSVSSTDSVQAVGLREPIVLLERTELTADQLSDTASPVTASKTTSKPKPEQAEIKIASPSKEAESRLQSNRAKDEGRSPDTQRLPTPPRSKRPRRENGAVATAESSESASETLPALSSLPSSDDAPTSERDIEPEIAPPASSTSLDDCVLRLLGASPTKALAEAKISESMSLKLAAKVADAPKDSCKDHRQHVKQQEQHQPKPLSDMAATSQATSRRTRHHAPSERASASVDAAEAGCPSHKQAKNMSSTEKHEQPAGTSATPKELFPIPSVYSSGAAIVASVSASSGRRDSVEAAVAALIGEPYEETPVYQPASVASSRSTKGDATVLRGDAAEKALTASSTAVSSPTASKSPSKKYSSTASSVLTAAAASSLAGTSSRDRPSRHHHKDDYKAKQGLVESEAKSLAAASAAASGGSSPGNSARSSRSRSSRHSRVDLPASRANAEKEEETGDVDDFKRILVPDQSLSVVQASSSTTLSSATAATAAEVHSRDSEKHSTSLSTLASAVPVRTKAEIDTKAEREAERKSELTNVEKEVQVEGVTEKVGTESSCSALPTRERRGRRKMTTEAISSEDDTVQSVHSATKLDDASRRLKGEVALTQTSRCTVTGQRSPDRHDQAVDAVSKVTAPHAETPQSSTRQGNDDKKRVAVDVVVAQCRNIAGGEVATKHENDLEVQSAAPDKSLESKRLEIENLVKSVTSDKKHGSSFVGPVGSSARSKSGGGVSAELESKKSKEPLQPQEPGSGPRMDTVKENTIAGQVDDDAFSNTVDTVETSANQKVDANRSVGGSNEGPDQASTEETQHEEEEEVCLILGDPDDADDDDVPPARLSQDTSTRQKTAEKQSTGDATPDIASAIERETSTTGNVSGAGDPDDLWEAVFCADHDQNAALERSVWSEAENSHRLSAASESPQEQSIETKQEGQEKSYSTSDNTVRLPDKFQPNVESAVASILDLQDPLDLEMRPSSSLSSVANETDRQEALGGSDTQGPSAPDVDSAVQGLLDEAPPFDEVADADADEAVGVVDELCIHDDENVVDDELVAAVVPEEAPDIADVIVDVAPDHRECSQGSQETPLATSSPIAFGHDDGSLLTSTEPIMPRPIAMEDGPGTAVAGAADAAAAAGDSGLLSTEVVIADDDFTTPRHHQQQPQQHDGDVDDIERAAHEAARRLSAEVRSVTGDVVESVATTSRLVEDAAGASRTSFSEDNNVNPTSENVPLPVPVDDSYERPSEWTAVDTAVQSPPENADPPRPASSRIGNVDDLKSSVNLSEESSSDSESDDDDENDDELKHALGAQRSLTRPTSAVKRPNDHIEPDLTPNTSAQPMAAEEEQMILDAPERSGDHPASGRRSSAAEIAESPLQPEDQGDENRTEQEADIRGTTPSDEPITLTQVSERVVESSVASIVCDTVPRCADDPDASPVAGTSGELSKIDDEGDTRQAMKDQEVEPLGKGPLTKKTPPSVTDEEQINLDEGSSVSLEPTAGPSLRRPDDSTRAGPDINESHGEATLDSDRNVVATKGLCTDTERIPDQQSPAAGLGSNDGQGIVEESSAEADQKRQGGDRPDSGSTERKQLTSTFKVREDSTVSSQPSDTSTPPGEAGPSQIEETREAACYSEENQRDVNKDLANAPVDKSTPPECTTSGIRGSTTSSSISEQSPSQDSPSCQQVPSVEASKPNSLVNYDLDSDSDEDEDDAAGPSEATAKDVPATNPPVELQSASDVERPHVENSAAGSSDDPIVATAANRIACDPPRHSGGDVSSSLRAPLASGPTNSVDTCTESTAASFGDEQILLTVNKKSEVTSSSDQPTQGVGVSSDVSPNVEASCQPSAEAAAELEQEMEPASPALNQENAEFINRQQGHQADASSSDDKLAPYDRLSELRSDEAEPELLQDRDQTQHQHAASSSSDATLENSGSANNASSTLATRTDQTCPSPDRNQPQPCSLPTEDEACSSSDKRMQSLSNIHEETSELVEEASSSGDASHTESQREAMDMPSSTEACTGQQPVCRATSSDDIADENSAAAAESSFDGCGTPLSSAASTPGAYVGSSSPPPAASMALQQDNQTASAQLHHGASASEPTGGASSSSDKKTSHGAMDELGCSLQSSPSSIGRERAIKDETTSREARAIAEDAGRESEASAVSGAPCSSQQYRSGEQHREVLGQEEVQSGASETDEAESNRDSAVGASNIAAEIDDDRLDVSDATKSGISSSEERATASGGSICHASGDSISSAVTPSDAANGQSGAEIVASIQLSEESGRGRCQSTSEQRMEPRASASSNDDDNDETGSCNVVQPEESLACSSSNSTDRPVDGEPRVTTDDDRDISSSNNTNSNASTTRANNNGVASAESEVENVSGSTAGPDDKNIGGEQDSGSGRKADDQDEAEATRSDNKQDISSSQETSFDVTSEDVNAAVDVNTKVSVATSGGNCSSSSNSSCMDSERALDGGSDCREVTDHVEASAGRSVEATESEAEQLTSSSVPSAACTTSGLDTFTVQHKQRTGVSQDNESAHEISPATNTEESIQELQAPHEADSTPERDEKDTGDVSSKPMMERAHTIQIVQDVEDNTIEQAGSSSTQSEAPSEVVVENIERSGPSTAYADQLEKTGDSQEHAQVLKSSESPSMDCTQGSQSQTHPQDDSSYAGSASDSKGETFQPLDPGKSASGPSIDGSALPESNHSGNAAQQANRTGDAGQPMGEPAPAAQTSNNDEVFSQTSQDLCSLSEDANEPNTSTQVDKPLETPARDEKPQDTSPQDEKSAGSASDSKAETFQPLDPGKSTSDHSIGGSALPELIAKDSSNAAEQANHPEDVSQPRGELLPAAQESNNDEVPSQISEEPDSPSKETNEPKASTQGETLLETPAGDEKPLDTPAQVETSREVSKSSSALSIDDCTLPDLVAMDPTNAAGLANDPEDDSEPMAELPTAAQESDNGEISSQTSKEPDSPSKETNQPKASTEGETPLETPAGDEEPLDTPAQLETSREVGDSTLDHSIDGSALPELVAKDSGNAAEQPNDPEGASGPMAEPPLAAQESNNDAVSSQTSKEPDSPSEETNEPKAFIEEETLLETPAGDGKPLDTSAQDETSAEASKSSSDSSIDDCALPELVAKDPNNAAGLANVPEDGSRPMAELPTAAQESDNDEISSQTSKKPDSPSKESNEPNTSTQGETPLETSASDEKLLDTPAQVETTPEVGDSTLDHSIDGSALPELVAKDSGNAAEQPNDPKGASGPMGEPPLAAQESNNDEVSSQTSKEPDSPSEETNEPKASIEGKTLLETPAGDEKPLDTSAQDETSAEANRSSSDLSIDDCALPELVAKDPNNAAGLANVPEDYSRPMEELPIAAQESDNDEISSQTSKEPDSPSKETNEPKASTQGETPLETSAGDEKPLDAPAQVETSPEVGDSTLEHSIDGSALPELVAEDSGNAAEHSNDPKGASGPMGEPPLAAQEPNNNEVSSRSSKKPDSPSEEINEPKASTQGETLLKTPAGDEKARDTSAMNEASPEASYSSSNPSIDGSALPKLVVKDSSNAAGLVKNPEDDSRPAAELTTAAQESDNDEISSQTSKELDSPSKDTNEPKASTQGETPLGTLARDEKPPSTPAQVEASLEAGKSTLDRSIDGSALQEPDSPSKETNEPKASTQGKMLLETPEGDEKPLDTSAQDETSAEVSKSSSDLSIDDCALPELVTQDSSNSAEQDNDPEGASRPAGKLPLAAQESKNDEVSSQISKELDSLSEETNEPKASTEGETPFETPARDEKPQNISVQDEKSAEQTVEHDTDVTASVDDEQRLTTPAHDTSPLTESALDDKPSSIPEERQVEASAADEKVLDTPAQDARLCSSSRAEQNPEVRAGHSIARLKASDDNDAGLVNIEHSGQDVKANMQGITESESSVGEGKEDKEDTSAASVSGAEKGVSVVDGLKPLQKSASPVQIE